MRGLHLICRRRAGERTSYISLHEDRYISYAGTTFRLICRRRAGERTSYISEVLSHALVEVGGGARAEYLVGTVLGTFQVCRVHFKCVAHISTVPRTFHKTLAHNNTLKTRRHKHKRHAQTHSHKRNADTHRHKKDTDGHLHGRHKKTDKQLSYVGSCYHRSRFNTVRKRNAENFLCSITPQYGTLSIEVFITAQ